MADPNRTDTATAADDAARLATFATLGALGVAQDLTRAVAESMDGRAEIDTLAEETLCLVAVATARAVEVAVNARPAQAASVGAALFDLPFTYRDYLLGGAMMVQNDPELAQAAEGVYERLGRCREFYAVHLPAGQFPGPRTLEDKMALWMGRVSPAGLPEKPIDRLERLELVPTLVTHLKLVLAFGRQQGTAG